MTTLTMIALDIEAVLCFNPWLHRADNTISGYGDSSVDSADREWLWPTLVYPRTQLRAPDPG